MAALPVDIDQLFIGIYYYFKLSSKRNQQFVDMWHSFYNNEPKFSWSIAKLGGWVYFGVYEGI